MSSVIHSSSSSSSSSSFDMIGPKKWAGTTIDTLLTEIHPIKVEPLHLNMVSGKTSKQQGSTVRPIQLQPFNSIRRSFSTLGKNPLEHTIASSDPDVNQPNFILDDDDNDDDQDSTTTTIIKKFNLRDSTLMSSLPPPSSIIEPQSAPVSPTDVSRRPSFSRILRKTFDMKSLFATTFDRQRKENMEREQEALMIWHQTFEKSLLQSSLSTSSSILSSSSTITNSNTISSNGRSSQYARFVMMELISTEETYLDDLLIIKTKFMDPLIQASQQSRPIINYRDIQTIFAFIPQLISLSSTLVQRLNSAQHDNDDDDDYDWIGYIFSDLESSFDVYIYYAVNFEKVRKCLAKIDCDALCYQILQDSSTRRKETKRMGLYDFLITPIQRITRYCLLLKDLQKNSTKSILVDRSLKCLSALACAMNEIQ